MPKNTGRLTLNPSNIFDPAGHSAAAVSGIWLGKACAGGAVKLQTRQGEYAFVAFAGVVCNIFIAFLLMNLLYFFIFICGLDLSAFWAKVLYVAFYNIIL